MKPKNFIRVAKLMEAALHNSKSNIGFNLATYCSRGSRPDRMGHACKTTACIAGFAYLEAGRTVKELRRASPGTIEFVAREFLGLNHESASDLFAPGRVAIAEGGLDRVSPGSAIATLYASAAAKRIIWVKEV